ncbi:hypothetical protein [Ectopseudomonas alcaliphila]|uniref:DUF3592 domain-containing protein n=1 Tax=Ectopseudomonas alcaliphila TaxID=101564 RepID=A0A1G7PCX6_9GAMM|nr:hypothetical protein [Pseudomonas alcaliphila]MDX5994481.1 hypothetical protein [Pseudomonas alcaliphila]SDF84153.1 hypothetical protein SAMN05216575_11225 [Pseudomonas alcaliphila]
MDWFELAMGLAITLLTPLLLLFWVVLMAGIGQWLYEGARSLGRPHSLVEARIIDQRQIDTRIRGNRISWIGIRTVYRLRYEYAGQTYEIEYLVRDEPQVMLDKDAGTFNLYVPHDRPAHAQAEHHPSQLIYGLILVGAMAYGSWLTAPFLVFWQ